MKIITVSSQKGGVGKTTTAVTLAHGLALKGKEVWLVDADPQGQCAVVLGLSQESGILDLLVARRPLPEVLRVTGRANLSIIPGDKRTSTAQIVLTAEGTIVDALAEALRPQRGDHRPDYIILDTPPSVGGLQEAAIFAADLVIVPCAVDFLALDGVVKIIETMQRLVNTRQWRGALLGILPTFYKGTWPQTGTRSRSKSSDRSMKDLVDTFGAERICQPIHDAAVLRECVAVGQTMWEYKPTGGSERAALKRVQEDYAALVWRLLDLGG